MAGRRTFRLLISSQRPASSQPSGFLVICNASELYDFLFTACHRMFVDFNNRTNDRVATKDDDEDEEDKEDALLFGMSVLSFCASLAVHYLILALPNTNSPDPK
jgi:hypothetical protein